MKNSLSFIWCMCVKLSSWNQMKSEQRTFIQCAKFACIVHNQYNFISTTLFYIYIYYIHIQFNNVGTKGERERGGEQKKKKQHRVCCEFLIDFLFGWIFFRARSKLHGGFDASIERAVTQSLPYSQYYKFYLN